MRILLDTHSLLWLLDTSGDHKLGTQAKQSLQAAEIVFASSINLLEINIKSMLCKLNPDVDLLQAINAAGLKIMDFTPLHSATILDFPALVRHDPFDRMLLAQAKSEDLSLLTSDQILLNLDLDFVLDARS